MKKKIENLVRDSIKVKEELLKSGTADVEKAALMIIKSLKAGGKLLIFGNGGSAADSQHIAAELVGRFKRERKGFGAIALTVNSSTLTAVANDYSYDLTFSRQIEGLGKSGDVAMGISTSGNSKNVIEAVRKAKSMGLKTISLAGCGGGKLKSECDISIAFESKDTPRVQEAHILVGHILCELIEEGMTV